MTVIANGALRFPAVSTATNVSAVVFGVCEPVALKVGGVTDGDRDNLDNRPRPKLAHATPSNPFACHDPHLSTHPSPIGSSRPALNTGFE